MSPSPQGPSPSPYGQSPSWLISDLGSYVAREPKNANFTEKCNHKNLSTLKTVVTKLGLSHGPQNRFSNETN